MHLMIDEFKKGGTRVYVAILPTMFEKPLSQPELRDLEQQFSGTEILDATALFDGGTGPSSLAYFRNLDHVGDRGAKVISNDFSDRLAVDMR